MRDTNKRQPGFWMWKKLLVTFYKDTVYDIPVNCGEWSTQGSTVGMN